ncbi:3-dehydroquinate synthase [Urechidicola croceus]|uniref:3-dehydroquinate synthase n=1 Tax=Urechidicola croceus TaxID=1850246 RepID=A0A1D8P560_9FLAO|nr:3-dehydroquinate synthase [Urechidicola croceus]AOW19717.1 3-dehydroquinate synthase [Urechidicola croceus]
MKSIKSDNYFIHFNENCYTEINLYLSNNKPTKMFLLVDENTHEYCAPKFLQQIETVAEIEIIEIESGEIHKNIDTCIGLWETLTELGADRKSLMINLGGGVITDMGGFVASTFKRGIKFINIPTTLLSMVDASAGGKTGVDLGVLKNQVGVFSNPEMVLIDSSYLSTVTDREIRSGMAEVIKYGVTYDVNLWNEVKDFKELNNSGIDLVIYRSIEIKNEVVLEDPKEYGLRKILNFGHTLGHAIESYHLESDQKENLTHGEAIAIGMITESFISYKLFDFPKDILEEIKEKLITIYGKFSIEKSDYAPIIELLKHDKKNTSGHVNFVLLSDLEKFKFNCQVSEELIIESLNYYQN